MGNAEWGRKFSPFPIQHSAFDYFPPHSLRRVVAPRLLAWAPCGSTPLARYFAPAVGFPYCPPCIHAIISWRI